MTSAVTDLDPWIGHKIPERGSVWMVAGYGAAGLLLNPDDRAASETNLSIPTAAARNRSELVAGDNLFRLTLKAEAL